MPDPSALLLIPVFKSTMITHSGLGVLLAESHICSFILAILTSPPLLHLHPVQVFSILVSGAGPVHMYVRCGWWKQNIPVDLYLKPSSPFDQSAVVLARRILKVYTSSNFTSNSHSHKRFYWVVIELQLHSYIHVFVQIAN